MLCFRSVCTRRNRLRRPSHEGKEPCNPMHWCNRCQKKPTSKQPKNGSCIGEASIVSQIINDLHDGRAGAELRPNVQRSRITSPVRPFKCWSAGDVRLYISTRPCRARPEMEKSMRVSFSSVCRLLSRCEIRHGGIGDRSGSPGSPPVNQLIAAQLCL